MIMTGNFKYLLIVSLKQHKDDTAIRVKNLFLFAWKKGRIVILGEKKNSWDHERRGKIIILFLIRHSVPTTTRHGIKHQNLSHLLNNLILELRCHQHHHHLFRIPSLMFMIIEDVVYDDEIHLWIIIISTLSHSTSQKRRGWISIISFVLVIFMIGHNGMVIMYMRKGEITITRRR